MHIASRQRQTYELAETDVFLTDFHHLENVPPRFITINLNLLFFHSNGTTNIIIIIIYGSAQNNSIYQTKQTLH